MTSTLSGSRKPSQTVHRSVSQWKSVTGLVMHQTACGQSGMSVLTDGGGLALDCKRCLASLAKRDRAFQRKARGWFARRAVLSAMAPRTRRAYASDRWRDASLNAARAIAREEGRAL